MNEGRDDDVSGIQVDLYGVKLKATPRPSAGEEPQTWRQVARGINRDLMSVVSNTFSFLADILRAARSLVRGVGGLSTLMAGRVNRAHVDADAIEAERSEISEPPPVKASLETVQRLLTNKRVQGLTGEAFSDATGEHIVLCFLPPMGQEEIEQVAAAALAMALPEAASRSLDPTTENKGANESGAKRRKRRRRRRKKKPTP